jgi:hypothetical protein
MQLFELLIMRREIKNNYKIRIQVRNDRVPKFINVSEYYKSILLSFSRLTKDIKSVNEIHEIN